MLEGEEEEDEEEGGGRREPRLPALGGPASHLMREAVVNSEAEFGRIRVHPPTPPMQQ